MDEEDIQQEPPAFFKQNSKVSQVGRKTSRRKQSNDEKIATLEVFKDLVTAINQQCAQIVAPPKLKRIASFKPRLPKKTIKEVKTNGHEEGGLEQKALEREKQDQKVKKQAKTARQTIFDNYSIVVKYVILDD